VEELLGEGQKELEEGESESIESDDRVAAVDLLLVEGQREAEVEAGSGRSIERDARVDLLLPRYVAQGEAGAVRVQVYLSDGFGENPGAFSFF
jgi:hypothetical protein